MTIERTPERGFPYCEITMCIVRYPLISLKVRNRPIRTMREASLNCCVPRVSLPDTGHSRMTATLAQTGPDRTGPSRPVPSNQFPTSTGLLSTDRPLARNARYVMHSHAPDWVTIHSWMPSPPPAIFHRHCPLHRLPMNGPLPFPEWIHGPLQPRGEYFNGRFRATACARS